MWPKNSLQCLGHVTYPHNTRVVWFFLSYTTLPYRRYFNYFFDFPCFVSEKLELWSAPPSVSVCFLSTYKVAKKMPLGVLEKLHQFNFALFWALMWFSVSGMFFSFQFRFNIKSLNFLGCNFIKSNKNLIIDSNARVRGRDKMSFVVEPPDAWNHPLFADNWLLKSPD